MAGATPPTGFELCTPSNCPPAWVRVYTVGLQQPPRKSAARGGQTAAPDVTREIGR